MNAVAVICPHCGAKRAGAELGTKGKQLSQNEIRALLVSDEILQARQVKAKSVKILGAGTALEIALRLLGVEGVTVYLIIGAAALALVARAVLKARAARRRALTY
ncbi:MAG TPA: hypothetical protein VFP84_33055 [Kofleriaceae bacterium]|nr:hypothetical protein [Kofleriaceae bacterium]